MITDYKLSERNLYLPVVKNILIYTDDGGSSGMDFVGFTSILVDEFASKCIEDKIGKICEKYGISDLHARELKFYDRVLTEMQEYERIYRELFEVTIYELMRANYQIVLNLLTSNQAIDGLHDDHFRIFDGVTEGLRYTRLNEDYIDLYSYFAFPTFEVMKRVRGCDENIKIKVYIDQKDNFEEHSKRITSLSGSLVSDLLEVHQAAVKVFNAHIKRVLKNNCSIDRLYVISRQSCPLLGVVDGVSNFAFNYAKCIIQGFGNSSETERLKYKVFKELFVESEKANRIEDTIKQNFRFEGQKIICLSNRTIAVLEIIQDRLHKN